MSSVLPFDVIALIIDIVGDNNDLDLLKALALVSHSFLQICNNHLFATVELHDAVPMGRTSSKKGFVKLLNTRPDVVKYIRKLTYNVSQNNYFQLDDLFVPVVDKDDQLLSPVLPNLLQTISQLNCLVINASNSDWTALDSSLTSALLHLMHLPTINHIDLSFIQKLPLSSLTPCVNLRQLDIHTLVTEDDDDGSPEIVQSEMPRIRQFYTEDSSLLTRKLLHAKRQDGQPALDFTDLKQLAMSFTRLEDRQNIQYLLQNAKLLEKLHLLVERDRLSLVGFHDILSPTARTLKVLEFTVPLCDGFGQAPLAGLCEELEAMAGYHTLEALAFQVNIEGHETEDVIGSIIHKVEKVLVKPGWSALKQVSFKLSIACCLVSRETSAKLRETLQSLPDNYLSHLSKSDSVAFNYSAYIMKCAFND